MITIANAAQYGNNAFIAPNARIDDGLFDVCILNSFPRIKGFQLGVKLFKRNIDKSRYMEIIRAEKIKFKKPSKKYYFHYDGEPIKIKREKVVIKIHPKVLRVIT